jgi:hypothetical protein
MRWKEPDNASDKFSRRRWYAEEYSDPAPLSAIYKLPKAKDQLLIRRIHFSFFLTFKTCHPGIFSEKKSA